MGSPVIASLGVAVHWLYAPTGALGRAPRTDLRDLRAARSATIPAGALLGGGLGQLTRTRPALILMSVGYTAFGLALVPSPSVSTAGAQHTKAR